MNRLIKAGLTAAFAVTALAGAAIAQPTINVLVVQEDWDPESIARNNRIQNATLSTFNQVLNSPAYQSQLQQYGIQGMDVYDETALTIDFYQQDRQRRTDQELISLVRTISNPPIDVLVAYTIYARAVTNQFTGITALQMSMSYRGLGVADGRYLGGDNIDLDTAGIPFTGCAAGNTGSTADPHCVKEFVSSQGERLARVAGNQLAIQLAALLGPAYGTGPINAAPAAPGVAVAPAPIQPQTGPAPACSNIPVTYSVTYRGFEQRAMNAIEENMAFWSCAMDMTVTSSDFAEITYSYKTRADQGRMLRNIRLMGELLGVVVSPQTVGNNQIIVESVGIRNN